MSKDNKSIRKFIYWPNFELSEDGSNIEVGTGAGLDVKVTISNSLVQCVGQPLSEKCRWFKMNIKYLATGLLLFFVYFSVIILVNHVKKLLIFNKRIGILYIWYFMNLKLYYILRKLYNHTYYYYFLIS